MDTSLRWNEIEVFIGKFNVIRWRSACNVYKILRMNRRVCCLWWWRHWLLACLLLVELPKHIQPWPTRSVVWINKTVVWAPWSLNPYHCDFELYLQVLSISFIGKVKFLEPQSWLLHANLVYWFMCVQVYLCMLKFIVFHWFKVWLCSFDYVFYML